MKRLQEIAAGKGKPLFDMADIGQVMMEASKTQTDKMLEGVKILETLEKERIFALKEIKRIKDKEQEKISGISDEAGFFATRQQIKKITEESEKEIKRIKDDFAKAFQNVDPKQFESMFQGIVNAKLTPIEKMQEQLTVIAPVVLTSGWTKEELEEESEEEEEPKEEEEEESGIWIAKGRRLWWTPQGYEPAEWNPEEITICDPCTIGQPSYAPGDRVFAVFRGRWEIVSGGGQTYFEGKIESENNGVYQVLLYKDTGTDTFEEPIEATTRYLLNAEKLEKNTIVGVTWTPMYGYRITHCEK